MDMSSFFQKLTSFKVQYCTHPALLTLKNIMSQIYNHRRENVLQRWGATWES